MEYKYRDKAYLTNYMLDTKLFDIFNLKVEDAVPIRTIYILTTEEGPKILKKIDYSIEELMFIYDALEHVRREYPFVVNYRESRFGTPYAIYEKDVYAVLDVISGRECSFELPSDLKRASKALALFHKAGEGVALKLQGRNRLFKLKESYAAKGKELLKYKEIANMHHNKSAFDKLFLEYVDYYIGDINRAIAQIETSEYMKLCIEKHTFCHHDLAYHNILINDEEKVYFIDFDYSIIDLPYHDLSNLMTKAIKHIGWNVENASIILEEYNEMNKLSLEELKVLYAYLLFPQDFYDISMNYYMRMRSWEEEDFVEKLRRKAEYREDRERFLKEILS